MGVLEKRAREFADEHGLTHVRFHKKWHKYDVYTATRVVDNEYPVYFLLDESEIRMATLAESERFREGHDVKYDMP